MEGFIQLQKKICDWEWYTDIPTCKLFFHILIKCNYREAKWKGKTIKPGEFITSLEHLSLETGLSRQQVRTAINKLKSTGEITHHSTNEYTTLVLNNWEVYNTQDNKRITNEQQTNNKRITTTNNNNKEYKENKQKHIFINYETEKNKTLEREKNANDEKVKEQEEIDNKKREDDKILRWLDSLPDSKREEIENEINTNPLVTSLRIPSDDDPDDDYKKARISAINRAKINARVIIARKYYHEENDLF